VILLRRTDPLPDPSFPTSIRRSFLVTTGMTIVMIVITSMLSAESKAQSLLALVAAVGAGAALYVVVMIRLRSPELMSVRSLMGRHSG
jgi:hypothetical protein